MKQSVFIIGSGGREHAIGWKLQQSPLVGKLYFAPGNGGTQEIGQNLLIDPTDVDKLVQFAKSKKIDLTVVGPEATLAAGLTDRFLKEGLKVFGPTQAAARLETSKAWATEFMERHNLPCPKSRIFDQRKEAAKYIQQLRGICVVKADGLCQGKGVYVCHSVDEAKKALYTLMTKKVFGEAGNRIVIQQLLTGQEVSMMAFCDGEKAVPLVAARDYKRIHDGNKGPNTGGMGAIAPPHISSKILNKIHALLHKTVRAMKSENVPFKGILYGGMMIVDETPFFLEFNCRFGDPETQVQLPLLASDFYTILENCVKGNLKPSEVSWSSNIAVCVVAASKGYPERSSKGDVINGLKKSQIHKNTVVFHAGTVQKENMLKTNGGRVLGVVGIGKTQKLARKYAYDRMKNISYSGIQYRKDISL